MGKFTAAVAAFSSLFAVRLAQAKVDNFFADRGEIRMPAAFPWAKYGNAVAQRWVITTGAGKRLRLTFDANFHVEKVPFAPTCYDRVRILDVQSAKELAGVAPCSTGMKVAATHCGDSAPPTYTSSGSLLAVEFCSDASVGLAGFAADWAAVDAVVATTAAVPPGGGAWTQCGEAAPQHAADVSAVLEPARRLVPMPRIVGGREVPAHSWPWLAAIFYRDTHYCGGAAIGTQWILTAAHCFSDMADWQHKHLSVKMGAHDRGGGPAPTAGEEKLQQVCKAAAIHAHPSFGKRRMENDIALVRLDCALRYTDTVRPVCLPPAGAGVGERLRTAGRPLVAAGWGATKSGDKIGSRTLKEAVLHTKAFAECVDAYRSTGEYLHEATMLCAAAPGTDTCQGDSGGPAMVKIDDKWTIVGVTSWGYGCADPAYPGIYTDVSSMLDWIDKTMNP